MRRVVVLDTNVYRESTFDELLGLETRRRVTPYADPFVILELLNHVVNPHDDSFRVCRRALWRVFTRCIAPSPGGRAGILKDSEDQIALLITGKRLPGHDEMTQRLCQLCQDVAETPLDQPLPFGPKDVRWIAQHVEQIEEWWINLGRDRLAHADNLLRQLEPNERQAARLAGMRAVESSEAFRNRLAEEIIRGACRDVGVTPPEPLPPKMVAEVRKRLAVGIEFYVRATRKVMFDGLNMALPKNRNLIWDHRISYCIGQRIGGAPVWFVTKDDEFYQAAEPVGHGARVRSVDQYLAWLRGRKRGLKRAREARGS